MTGFVIGCDSDDGPPVNGGNGNGGNGEGTRNEEALTRGDSCGRRNLPRYEIRNTCNDVALNVGLRCSSSTTGSFRHYRIEAGGSMPDRLLDCGGTFLFIAYCAAPAVAVPSDGERFTCNDNTGITPTEYVGTPPRPQPRPPLYGSIAFGHLSGGGYTGYTWNFQYGCTRSEARSSALAECRSDGSTDCRSLEFGRGQCAALAHGTRTIPSFGVASRSTRLAAQNAAIAQCRSARGTNCRIATGRSGDAASAGLSS